jgi:hypothetical protein
LELANIYIYFHSPIAFPSDVSSFCKYTFWRYFYILDVERDMIIPEQWVSKKFQDLHP